MFNIHALIHLSDVVNFFKCSLSDTTAFPFENLLGKLKKMIHSGRKPLQQLCRRMSEKFSIIEEKATIPPAFLILKSKQNYCKKEEKITSFKYHDYTYSTCQPNNCVLLQNGEFALISNIAGSKEDDICIHGNKMKKIANAYEHPTKSADLNIHEISQTNDIIQFKLKDIDVKALFLNIYKIEDDEKKQYVLPMLH